MLSSATTACSGPRQNGGMTSRAPLRWLALTLGVLGSWLLGAVVVRLGLDWADTFPYSSESEVRYLVIAGVALVIAIGGSIASILWVRRGTKP